MVLTALLALQVGFGDGFVGVWLPETSSEPPFVIGNKSYGTFDQPGKFISTYNAKWLEAGSWRGAWVVSDTLTSPYNRTTINFSTSDSRGVAVDSGSPNDLLYAENVYVPIIKNNAYVGAAFIRPIPVSGRTNVMKVFLDSKGGKPMLDTHYRFAGGPGLIGMAGKFADTQVECDLTDTPSKGASSSISGSLTAGGVRYLVSGNRTWGRGAITLKDSRNNASAGSAILVWTPSQDWVKKAKEDKKYPSTDRLTIILAPGTANYPNGAVRPLLTRS